MLLGGAWAIAGMAATPPNDPPVEGVIEITDQGVNPAVCTMNRNDDPSVRWFNASSSTRWLKDDQNPLVDTGPFEPGTYSESFSFPFAYNNGYTDQYDPTIKGKIVTTVQGSASCTAFPPTPTPSPTPIGGIPTPTPTPIIPEACIGRAGCALSPNLSREEE